MAKLIGDTGDEATSLAKGVLLELLESFPDLRAKSAIGGGIAVVEWLGRPPDMGPLNTSDVDLVLDVHIEESYPTLRKNLLESGKYATRNDRRGKPIPYSFFRVGRDPAELVQVDFQGTDVKDYRGGKDREDLQVIGDLPAKRLTGGTLALQTSVPRRIRGGIPGGKELEGEVRIVPAFMLVPLKAVAFQSRGLKGVDPEFRRIKDAADLYALLKYSPEKPAGLGKAIKQYGGRTVVEQAFESMGRHFLKERSQGVDAVIEFLQGRLPEAIVRREVVELSAAYLAATK